LNLIATVDGKLVHVPKPEARVHSARGSSNMVHWQRTDPHRGNDTKSDRVVATAATEANYC
jgi:hypothetical protein